MAIIKERPIHKLDGTIVTEIRPSRPVKRQVRGGDRKGFSSRSGMAAMTDPELAHIERPTVDKAAPLIMNVRFIGKQVKGEQPADVLTAQGHALYEFLMAAARIQGIENDEVRVLLTDAKKFLGIKHNDRLKALVEQLNETMVAYDFTVDGEHWTGKIPLLSVDYLTTLHDGKAYMVFSVHPRVKRVITEARSWAKLDINAYSAFTSKYSARLYPRFKLISQYHEGVRQPWTVSPRELAEIVGYTWTGDFHFGNFENRVLKPVMKDMDFLVLIDREYIRGKGRGAPVELIKFHISPSDTLKAIGDGRLRAVNKAQFSVLLSDITADERYVPEHMPPADLVLKAALRLKREPFDLIDLWKNDLIKAHSYPSMQLHFDLTGQQIIDLTLSHGAATAFEKWAQHVGEAPQKPKPSFNPDERRDVTVHESGRITSVMGGAQPVHPALFPVKKLKDQIPSMPDAEIKTYCSVEHPLFKTHLNKLKTLPNDSFDDVDSAMIYASKGVGTLSERVKIISQVCSYILSWKSDKQAENLHV